MMMWFYMYYQNSECPSVSAVPAQCQGHLYFSLSTLLLKAGKGCALGLGLPLKQVKILVSHVERENMDRTKDSLLVLENHAASRSDLCQMCLILGFACSAQHLLTLLLFPFRVRAGRLNCHPRYGVYSTAKPCLWEGERADPQQYRGLDLCKGRRNTHSIHSLYSASLAVPWCEALLQ